ncbi:MAG: hypothetical protein A2W31_08635 [Planctomycetes bacterium RBG_16_64_10]|nr:MAG: hypothetical protein A2W31_08635 [Planctomycetes bacterium RBG_16_64_10]
MEVQLACDVLVAGGGMAGLCAALAAARHGARVVLVQNRSRLGGNASSEVKMHIVGADHSGQRPGWREGGIINEIRLDDAARNPQRCWELFDLLLYDKVVSEPNITLLLDSTLFAVDAHHGRIEAAYVRCDTTEHLYVVRAHVYGDCTGDGRLGLEAGAEMRIGREARSEFNEPLAPEQPDQKTLGSSILFTARKYDRPMPFTPPKWARRVSKEQLVQRRIQSWEYGYWWLEWGGQLNTIHDNSQIRFELLAIVMGVWDYIKNSGAHPDSAPWALDWVGMLPGKRESRRLIGDYILTQRDLMESANDFEDAVAIGGWPMDDHPPAGFDQPDVPPCVLVKTPIYNIPLRALYSRNIRNLMMAGRNISASHVAFTSTRVMATCAAMGQAIGTAAAWCSRDGLDPRQLAADQRRLGQLQQALLRDDQTIHHRQNEDPLDLARTATARASGQLADCSAANVINGLVRDIPGQSINRWSAELGADGAWIELSWTQSQQIGHIQITFDAGFSRPLALTSQDDYNARMVRGPQPETVRDYTLEYRPLDTGPWTVLAQVRNNYQRLVRHDFDPVDARAVRVHVTATNGDPAARIFEIRCYRQAAQ